MSLRSLNLWETTSSQSTGALRNEVVLALYLRRDLWDRFMESRIKSHPTN